MRFYICKRDDDGETLSALLGHEQPAYNVSETTDDGEALLALLGREQPVSKLPCMAHELSSQGSGIN